MLIPDNIKEFVSNGEKLLYLKFKHDRLAKNMYVLHSVFTNYHIRNVSGELDFLVLFPGHGIFAIEVKHGRVSRKKGLWSFTDGSGKTTTKTTSPFAQVTATMHSVRKFILEKIKSPQMKQKINRLLWGYGVAFTSMDKFPDPGPEGAPWQVLTKEGLKTDISEYLISLSNGFHHKYRNMKWYDPDLSRPTASDCEYIIQLIRGDFDMDYTELNKLREGNQIIEEFTIEQFNLLDITNYNDRCLFEGGAGTGKTLLAMELFKRKISEGLRVGFFCYNRNLGTYLKMQLEKYLSKNNSYIGSFHSFMMQGINYSEKNNEFDDVFFSQKLPVEFIIEIEYITDNEKFDYLIIDEAQDLVTPLYLEVFDLILKNGLNKGKWVFFGDFSKQSIFVESSREDFLKLLRSKADFVTMPPLRINCRNTKKIARQNSLLTGTDFPEFINGGLDGEPIDVKFIDSESYTLEVENTIQKLLNGGIPPEEIVVLCPMNFKNTSWYQSDFIKNALRKGLTVSTIQSFKGLEKNIVIITNFETLSDQKSQKLMYIAISRARQRLYIILDRKLEIQYRSLIEENIKKVGFV